jgi:uncharacterized protein (TIGR01732 family)
MTGTCYLSKPTAFHSMVFLSANKRWSRSHAHIYYRRAPISCLSVIYRVMSTFERKCKKMDNSLPMSNALPVTFAPNVLPQAPMAYSYAAPVYGSCFPVSGCNEFLLIVVLFILLIIVGAVCFFR